MGSFDSVNAPLREAFTALRMTGVESNCRARRNPPTNRPACWTSPPSCAPGLAFPRCGRRLKSWQAAGLPGHHRHHPAPSSTTGSTPTISCLQALPSSITALSRKPSRRWSSFGNLKRFAAGRLCLSAMRQTSKTSDFHPPRSFCAVLREDGDRERQDESDVTRCGVAIPQCCA